MRTSFIVSVCSIGILGVTFAVRSAKPPGATPPSPGNEDRLLHEHNSRAWVMAELAAERHAANTKRGQKWILTTHHGLEVLKFTDKEYTLVALPSFDPQMASGLSLYAAQYNGWSERGADLKVQRGEYEEAAGVYRLLVRFDAPDFKERREKKLALLQKLKKGEDSTAVLREFMKLSDDLGTVMELHKLDDIALTVVTNLLEVRLP